MADARAALVTAAARLAPVSATPRLDAELLMAHAMGCDRSTLLVGRMREPEPDGFAALVERRMLAEPVAYITGRRGFWTIELAVAPGVLIPRADSETLIEAAVERFGGQGPRRVLDLGTGPGTLLLAALHQWPDASGIGVDRSEMALAQARGNSARLGMDDRAVWRQGDWAEGIAERFDLILCNPPYIGRDEPLMREVAEHEPGEALYADGGGLDAYRRIVPTLSGLLNPGGAAILEIGHRQGEAVTDLVEHAGMVATLRRDLGGHPRAIIAVAREPTAPEWASRNLRLGEVRASG